MPKDTAAQLEFTDIAASTAPLRQRAEALLAAVRRFVPYDGAWLALADPYRSSYSPLAGADLDDSTVTYLSGPRMAGDIEMTGADSHTMTFYGPGAEGKERKTGELVYARKK